ncbi:uncharacterized protein LOC112589673 [Harpegnathos saltator]|uniref:uncharacterized protein LOC112589673 n=1 Tax=Harpegnathos saltator TaxID=610380 RepID=UPI000DBED529|nr:uncharacterized protein LOC112589673 [Harpegnathos saltator]
MRLNFHWRRSSSGSDRSGLMSASRGQFRTVADGPPNAAPEAPVRAEQDRLEDPQRNVADPELRAVSTLLQRLQATSLYKNKAISLHFCRRALIVATTDSLVIKI